MAYKIEQIEGIGPVYAAKLARAGIKTAHSLLTSCADPKGRDMVSEKTTISPQLLLKWANMADLMRISGIGRQFAELLEASGVDTVKELKHRLPDNLAAKMAEVNAQKQLCRANLPEIMSFLVCQTCSSQLRFRPATRSFRAGA